MASPAESTSGSRTGLSVNDEKKNAPSIAQTPPPAQTDAAAPQSHSTTLDRDIDNSNDNDTIDSRSKKSKSKRPKKKSAKPRAAALDDPPQIVRDHINALKDQLKTTTENSEEYQKQEYAIEQLEQVYAKLSTSSPSSAQPPPKRHGLTTDETLTMLQFFYMVRLAQQGLFTLVPDLVAGLETEALVYFCDKLVGSSLFLPPNNSPKRQVFDLLRKLHDGADEPVGPGYSTTYSQIRQAVEHAIKNSLHPPQQTNAPQPPVWVVVPFNNMIDLPQPQPQSEPQPQSQPQQQLGVVHNNSSSSKDKHPESTTTVETSLASHPPHPPTETTNNSHSSTLASVPDEEGEEDHRHDENGGDDHGDDFESGHGGRGRGSRGRGYRRGRGRGRGLHPPRGGDGRRFSRGNGTGKIWVPREST